MGHGSRGGNEGGRGVVSCPACGGGVTGGGGGEEPPHADVAGSGSFKWCRETAVSMDGG